MYQACTTNQQIPKVVPYESSILSKQGEIESFAFRLSFKLLKSSSPPAFFNQFHVESHQLMLSSLPKKVNLQGDESQPASFPNSADYLVKGKSNNYKNYAFRLHAQHANKKVEQNEKDGQS